MKLIVFIEPSKFIKFISNTDFKNQFGTYNEENGNTSYYENEIIYINNNFDYEFENYNSEKINNTPIIILRDTFNNNYLLGDLHEDFYILRHSIEPKLFKELLKNNHYKGQITQLEESQHNGRDSIYNKLAQKFGGNSDEKATNFISNNFIEDLNIKNKLNNALEFLHKCLGSDKNKAPELPDEFKNCKQEYENWKNEENDKLTKLKDLRDKILEEINLKFFNR